MISKNITPSMDAPDYMVQDALYAYGGGDSASKDTWICWKEISEGQFYVFLPSSVDCNVFLRHSFSAIIRIVNTTDESNSIQIPVGGALAQFSVQPDVPYSITESGIPRGYITFMYAENCQGSVFIVTTDDDGNYQDRFNELNANKNAKIPGRIVACDDTGASTIENLDHIKGHGNSTWNMPKKGYSIKMENRHPLFDIDSSKKWVLLANYQEGTLMRNKIVYDLSNEIQLKPSPEVRFTDFYVNGNYRGDYSFTEKVEIGDHNLVGVTDLSDETDKMAQSIEGKDFDVYGIYGTPQYQTTTFYNDGTIAYYDIPSEYNPTDITGGYLLEINVLSHALDGGNYFVTPRNQAVAVISPEYCTEAQIKYIYDFYVSVEDAIYEKSPTYSELIDVESWAKMYLIQEWVKNIDGGTTSTFCFKDIDSENKLLRAAPVWDFDVALGNLFGGGNTPEGTGLNTDSPLGWFTRYVNSPSNSKIYRVFGALAHIDSFWDVVIEVWNENFPRAVQVLNGTEAPLHARLKSISDYQSAVEASAAMNYVIWPLPYNNNNGDFSWIPCPEQTFDGQVAWMQEWINERTTWLDRFLNNPPTPGEPVTVYFDNSVTKWDDVFLYAWDNEGGGLDGAWPGIPMTEFNDTAYALTLPYFDNIVFSDGTGSQTVDLVDFGDGYIFYATAMGPSGKWTGSWSLMDAE